MILGFAPWQSKVSFCKISCCIPEVNYILCEDMILATCQCQHIFCCWVEPSLLLPSFCQDLFWQLVICLSSSYDHHIIIGWRPFHHKADKTKQMLVFLKVRNSWFLSYDQFIQFSSYFSKPYTFKAESHTVVHWL